MQAIIGFFQNEIVIQAIGFIGMAISLIAMQCKSYRRLTLLRICSEFTFGFQFMLVGAWSGMVTNFAAVFTNSVYRYRIKRERSTLPFQIAFALLYTGLCILTWHGWVSLLVIGAKVLSTVAMGIKSTRTIRIINLFSNPMWVVYDVYAGVIGGLISDSINILFILLALLRIDVLPAVRARRAERAKGEDASHL